MVLVLRAFLLLLPILVGVSSIPASTQKVFQVSRARVRPAGWSGDRPGRQLSHPRPPPPLLLLLPSSSAAPSLPSHPRPPLPDRVARTKRSLPHHTRGRHTPSSNILHPTSNIQRERRHRSTQRTTPPQTRSLRKSRNRSRAERRAKNNKGLKKAGRKKKGTSARHATVGDAARASYVIRDTADTDEQTELKETLYPSPAFIRSRDQGQVFQHYGDFDRHTDESAGIAKAGETRRPLSQAALGTRASRQTGIIDSDTILKDGQIFHRHDAREERHARPGDQQLLFNEAPQRDVADPTGRFFTAEALNSGGHSQTWVAGNMHGVDGAAVTLSGGKVTQAVVTLGENSSSSAHVTDDHGAEDPILISSVGADQSGGASDARARVPATATTHAQIELSPADYDEAVLGDHGTASALLTPNGESTLATLGGQASRGSYLGTAHSSTLQEHLYPAHSTHMQPHFDNGQLQPPFTNGQVQPSYTNGNVQQFFTNGHVQPSYTNGHILPSFDNGHVQSSYTNGHTLPSFDNGHVQNSYTNGHVQPPFESEPTQRQDGRNMNSTQLDMSDMLSSIMETVHQPHLLPEVAALPPATPHLPPPGTKLIVARKGMVGGSGVPPKESEVGQVSQQQYQEQEGDDERQASPVVGQVGIATYFQGELGAPPNTSDLTGPPSEDYTYNPSNYYDLNYPTDYQSPYLDLDPKIFSVEPVELDFDALYPTPAPPLLHPQPNQTFHSPIVVHQLHTSTPDFTPHPSPPPQETPETVDHSQTQNQSQIPDDSHTTGQQHVTQNFETLDHIPGYPQVPEHFDTPAHVSIPGQPYTSDPSPEHVVPDYFQYPDYTTPDYFQFPEYTTPDYSNTVDYSPDYSHIPEYSHIPDQPQSPDRHIPQQPSPPTALPSPQLHTPSSFHTSDHIPAEPPTPDQTSSQTTQPPAYRPTDTRVSGAAAADRNSVESVQATPMPMGVPLVPGQPGSSQMLPNGDGPVLNVITMPVNHRMDTSMMHQHPGAPIQPGEKIPGAPGYKIPAGFRGRIILGHSLPVEASSQNRMEGFNARLRLTPQSPASDMVFASVSSPQASQQLTSEGGIPGVRVTLGDRTDRHQQYRAPAPHLSMASRGHTSQDRMQGDPLYSTGRRQWASRPSARYERPSHRGESGATSENGWQNGRGRPSATSSTGSWNQGHTSLPSKSWNGRQVSPQERRKQCAYITIICRVEVNDLGNRRRCQPSYTKRKCCC